MQLITKRVNVQNVVKLWEAQYYPGHGSGADKDQIAQELRGLNLETASPEQVNKIIGNEAWTRVPACGECGVRPEAVVVVGSDYEDSTHLCLGCARRVVALIEHAAECEYCRMACGTGEGTCPRCGRPI